MQRSRRGAVTTAVGVLGLVAFGGWGVKPVSAQQMDEEKTRITTRSDVQMEIESGKGTSGERLAAVGRVVGAELATIKKCYADVIAERPTVEGEMRLEVALPPRGRVRVNVAEQTVEDRALRRCVERAVERAEYASVDRPANAVVGLRFTNTAAEGAERTERRRAREEHVTVQMDADGNPVATGGTPDGRVRFRVIGRGREDAGRMGAVHRGVRASIPALLDCRRRSGTRGRSPAGEVEVALRVAASGRARARAGRTTVRAGELAARCVARGLSQTRFPGDARGASRVVVAFAEDGAGDR